MISEKPLPKILSGISLSREEARQWLNDVLEGKIPDCETGAVLSALAMKGESSSELSGILDSLREHIVRFPLPEEYLPSVIDTCGTGGDGSGSFNVSTTVAFILAGGSIPVVKHGNRAISSRSGSADVLEALGIRIDVSPERSLSHLEQLGITFLWAPIYHPALKVLAPVRKALGIRTVINLVAPLANPALLKRQILGVSSADLVPVLADVLEKEGASACCVVHGDGLDEATLSGPTHVCRMRGGVRTEEVFYPGDFGLTASPKSSVAGGDAARNAAIVREVLSGKPGPFLDYALANAALGLWVAERVSDLREGVAFARETIRSKKPMEILDKWIRRSQETHS